MIGYLIAVVPSFIGSMLIFSTADDGEDFLNLAMGLTLIIIALLSALL